MGDNGGGNDMKDYENFVDGAFVPSSGKARLVVSNPSTGQGICTVPDSSEADVEAAISAAELAQRSWAKQPAIQRAKVLHAIATRIRQHAEEIAHVITEEQGKTQGLAQS